MSYPRRPNLYLSEEHVDLRTVIAKFVANKILPNVDGWEHDRKIPPQLYEDMAKAGFYSLRASEPGEDLERKYLPTLILCEELAKCNSLGVALTIMVSIDYALSLLDIYGSDFLKATFLKPALRGKAIGAIALTEPDCGSDLTQIKTRATKSGSHYIIRGSKSFTSNAPISDFVTVLARTSNHGALGLSLFVVPTELAGVSIGPALNKLGLHPSATAEIFFDDCEIHDSHLLGQKGRAMQYLIPHFSLERLIVAALAIGACEHLIEMALDYGTSRRVFSAPILEHQVWKHRFAKCVAQLEALRGLTYQAAYLFGIDDPSAHQFVAMAKLQGAQVAQDISREVLQLHGAFGQIEQSPIPRYFRDLAAFSVGAGTSEIMCEIIANGLVERISF